MQKDKSQNPAPKKSAPTQVDTGERIAKFMARAGIASRRDSEKLILDGRVKINGKVLKTPACKVTAKDVVTFDGQDIRGKEPPRLWRYHKPSGLVTSHKDEKGRETVFEKLPDDMPRVISVGRLDLTSEGLLLLTNDGELARALELPSTGWARRYRARAFGSVTQQQLDTLQKGIKIDGVPTGPIEATLDKQQGGNAWISVSIREGKNREVRRALNTLGLDVNRLIRVSYGPFQLGTLPGGAVEEVRHKILRDQVGHLVDIPASAPTPRGTAPKAARVQKAPRTRSAPNPKYTPKGMEAERQDGQSKTRGKLDRRKGGSPKGGPKNSGRNSAKPPSRNATKNSPPKGRGKFAKR